MDYGKNGKGGGNVGRERHNGKRIGFGDYSGI